MASHFASKRLWRFLHKPPQVVYAFGLGPLLGRRVLLLTTTGRKTGLPRVTPLQFEEVDGRYLIGSARGVQADWVRNIMVEPRVSLRVGSRRFDGHAEVSTDVNTVTAFMELRLDRHPRMMRAILRRTGLQGEPTRDALAAYAANIALVTVHATTPGSDAAPPDRSAI